MGSGVGVEPRWMRGGAHRDPHPTRKREVLQEGDEALELRVLLVGVGVGAVRRE